MVKVILLKQKSIKANAIQFLDDESSKKEILKVFDNYHIQYGSIDHTILIVTFIKIFSLHEKDWLIYNNDGKFEILTDKQFHSQYRITKKDIQ